MLSKKLLDYLNQNNLIRVGISLQELISAYQRLGFVVRKGEQIKNLVSKRFDHRPFSWTFNYLDDSRRYAALWIKDKGRYVALIVHGLPDTSSVPILYDHFFTKGENEVLMKVIHTGHRAQIWYAVPGFEYLVPYNPDVFGPMIMEELGKPVEVTHTLPERVIRDDMGCGNGYYRFESESRFDEPINTDCPEII